MAKQEQQQQGGNNLEQDKAAHNDCLACRVTGVVFAFGLSGYLVAQYLAKDPPPKGLHKFVYLGMAGTLAGLGIYRATHKIPPKYPYFQTIQPKINQ